MKTKQEIKKDLFATLAELQSKTAAGELENYLRIKLQILYDILEEEIDEEYWEQIEKEL